MTDFQTIRYDVDGNLAVITLNRPDRMNAYTAEMGDEIIQAMDLAEADDSVRVVIFTGEGKAFCAGADLGKGEDTFNYESGSSDQVKELDWKNMRDPGGVLTLRLFQSTKPLIAAINGPAVGIGATMTLPMDIRVAADSIKMGFVFCSRGIVPDGAASWFLPQIVGLPQSLEWVMTGRVFDAEEGLKGGLFRSIHPAGELMAVARSLAAEIADNTSAVSVAYSRQLLWRMACTPHPMEAHRHETRGIFYTGKGADAREGVMSFLEKRPARYTLSARSDMPPNYPWWQEPEFE